MMKKIAAFLALILLAAVPYGCSAGLEVKIENMNKVFSGQTYERCVYSAEINNGKADAAKQIYTDPALSELVVEFEKTADGLAHITTELTVVYTSTPPYFNPELDCAGMTDRIRSEAIFNGYSDAFNPISVKKELDLDTSRAFDEKDKSFKAEFLYPDPVKKAKGEGKYSNLDGSDEKTFTAKVKSLKNAFDNEQLYYLISALMRGTVKDDATALGYTKQYKFFNLFDRINYGKGAQSYGFTVAAAKLNAYQNVTVTGNIAQVTVSFPKGQPLIMYYSLGEDIKIGGAAITARPRLMLGYTQKTSNSTAVLSETQYVLKSYEKA